VRQFLFFPEKRARVKIFENESVRAREIFCLGLTVADEEEEEGRTISSHQFSLLKSEKSALSGRGDVSSLHQ
jgi:hypothetical protein